MIFRTDGRRESIAAFVSDADLEDSEISFTINIVTQNCFIVLKESVWGRQPRQRARLAWMSDLFCSVKLNFTCVMAKASVSHVVISYSC